jgi:hypothetical protein
LTRCKYVRRDTQHPLESHSALTEVVELIDKHLILGELAREFWASKTHDLAASNQRGFWASRKIVGKDVGLGKTTHLARFVAPKSAIQFTPIIVAKMAAPSMLSTVTVV